MGVTRVSGYIDGFNLYHAICDTGLAHLKWLDLWKLCELFTSPPLKLDRVLYFSAYATWLPAPYARHREYVAALAARGVTPILGNFKQKPAECKRCKATWIRREEKETDVNIALRLFQDAVDDVYDRALLFSGDSDLAPAVRLVKARYPQKEIRIIAPFGRQGSGELVHAANCLKANRLIPAHGEQCLLPQQVIDGTGNIVATRPPSYDPPSRARARAAKP